MITYISIDNISSHANAMKAQYKLRHRAFLERQSYKVFSYNNMEYDQYDNPSAIYLVYEDEARENALGVSRLTPTAHRSMLKDIYPEMVEDHSIFEKPQVWEGTRFCVERSVSPDLRRRISNELVGAYFELGLYLGIQKIMGMMPNYILQRVFKDSGCQYDHLGVPKIIDRQKIQAASLDITLENFIRFKEKTGIHGQIIENLLSNQKVAA